MVYISTEGSAQKMPIVALGQPWRHIPAPTQVLGSRGSPLGQKTDTCVHIGKGDSREDNACGPWGQGKLPRGEGCLYENSKEDHLGNQDRIRSLPLELCCPLLVRSGISDAPFWDSRHLGPSPGKCGPATGPHLYAKHLWAPVHTASWTLWKVHILLPKPTLGVLWFTLGTPDAIGASDTSGLWGCTQMPAAPAHTLSVGGTWLRTLTETGVCRIKYLRADAKGKEVLPGTLQTAVTNRAKPGPHRP